MDDDADSAGTPPPPEQRPWRHPSELYGAPTTWAAQVEAMRNSRRRETLMAAGAGLIGAVAAGAFLVLLLPGSSDGPTLVAPAANSSAVSLGTVVATTVERTAEPPVPTTTPMEPAELVDAPMTTTAATTTTTTTVLVPTTPVPTADGPTLDVPWPTLEHNGVLAVPLADSGLFLTTAAGVDGSASTYTVRWGNTQERLAKVVARGEGYAVLQLDRRLDVVSGMRVAGMAPTPGTWVTVWSGDRHRAVVVQQADGLALAGVGADRQALEGAPVVDEQGHLVGLCSQRRGTMTLIPVVGLETVIESRRETAWLGVAVNSGEVEGQPVVTVTEVTADSPASRAGIAVDDRIVSFGGELIDSVVRLADRVESKRPGDVIVVEVQRDGAVVALEVTLTSRPFSL